MFDTDYQPTPEDLQEWMLCLQARELEDEEAEWRLNLAIDEMDGEPYEDPMQADAEVLAMAGMGTDEDYGYYEGYDF